MTICRGSVWVYSTRSLNADGNIAMLLRMGVSLGNCKHLILFVSSTPYYYRLLSVGVNLPRRAVSGWFLFVDLAWLIHIRAAFSLPYPPKAVSGKLLPYHCSVYRVGRLALILFFRHPFKDPFLLLRMGTCSKESKSNHHHLAFCVEGAKTSLVVQRALKPPASTYT